MENASEKSVKDKEREDVEDLKDETLENKNTQKQEGVKSEKEFDITDLLPDNIEEIVKLQILQMKEWAHIYMGFLPHPKKKMIVQDLRQAKIAIDSTSALVDVLLPHVSKDQQRELKILVSDLKMNFISKKT